MTLAKSESSLGDATHVKNGRRRDKRGLQNFSGAPPPLIKPPNSVPVHQKFAQIRNISALPGRSRMICVRECRNTRNYKQCYTYSCLVLLYTAVYYAVCMVLHITYHTCDCKAAAAAAAFLLHATAACCCHYWFALLCFRLAR